jgi:nitrate/TMAO reductase-like tetraheme cytochrome c subunit
MPRTLPRFAAVLALVACVALVVPAAPPYAAPNQKPDEVTIGGQLLFATWPKGPKPDAVIVVSGQTYGYLQPCGCSRPQTGGLERRAVFIEHLKAKGWPVAAVDVGDVFPDGAKIGDQARMKYVAAMSSMREMGYLAVGLGKSEIKSSLFNTLASYGLQKEQRPFTLAANAGGLIENKFVPREEHFKLNIDETKRRPLVEAVEVATVGKVPVGVGGVVGKALHEANRDGKWDIGLDFPDAQAGVRGILKALANHPTKPELKVLLFQGPSADAELVAKFDKGFDVIVSSTDETNPPMVPAKVGDTLVVHTGTRGQYVGVVGAFKKPGGGFDLHYQLVPMTEAFLTPGADSDAYKANKVLPILQEYAKQVKDANLLKEWPKVDHPAQLAGAKLQLKLKYVGSEACKQCHAAEYAVWDKTPHGHALDALEKIATRPTLRNFDPECVRCHTVGFDHKTGYVDAATTPALKHVGCESCHGPGSAHVDNPRAKDLQELLRPWAQRQQGVFDLPDMKFIEKMAKLDVIERGKVEIQPVQQILINQVSGTCSKCHDADNDPNFDLYKYWPKIVHGKKRAPAEVPKQK